MLLLVLGGIGSGKSAYAALWAASLGREAIRLSCPTFPGGIAPVPDLPRPAAAGFAWREMEADENLAATLNRINRESNIFRADRRVLVVDSLSAWLRGSLHRDKQAGKEPAGLDEVLKALLSYEGKRIVVCEEAWAGLAEDPWERKFAGELARAVRLLAEESHAVYRMTAGFAAELKGYQVKRGNLQDENIHPNRR